MTDRRTGAGDAASNGAGPGASTGAGELTGAWKRVGLEVDGKRVKEPCEVLWLQSEKWYADIRIPVPDAGPTEGPESLFARAWAFAGAATWDPPVMTWEHMLDSEPDPSIDSNPLEVDGDVAMETGQIDWHGRTVEFCEEWHRISPARVTLTAHVDANRVEITVGRWRVSVLDERPYGPFRAGWYELVSATWQPHGTVHVPADD
jgi:hypothetical protein